MQVGTGADRRSRQVVGAAVALGLLWAAYRTFRVGIARPTGKRIVVANWRRRRTVGKRSLTRITDQRELLHLGEVGKCVTCARDTECQATNADKPYCSQRGVCGVCSSAAQCRDNAAKPVCRQDTDTCGSCTGDAECAAIDNATRGCDVGSPLLLYAVDGSCTACSRNSHCYLSNVNLRQYRSLRRLCDGYRVPNRIQ